MKTYTMQEACNALAIDNATLFRWMKRAGMKVTPDEQDKRRRVLTHTQLALLAKLHHRSLLAQHTVKTESSEIAELQERIDALERHIQAMQETLERLTLATSNDDVSPIEKTPRIVSQRVASHSSTLPDGWIPINDLIKQYHTPRSTAIRHMKPFIHTGKWRVNGHEVLKALDSEGQAEFIKEFGSQ